MCVQELPFIKRNLKTATGIRKLEELYFIFPLHVSYENRATTNTFGSKNPIRKTPTTNFLKPVAVFISILYNFTLSNFFQCPLSIFIVIPAMETITNDRYAKRKIDGAFEDSQVHSINFSSGECLNCEG